MAFMGVLKVNHATSALLDRNRKISVVDCNFIYIAFINITYKKTRVELISSQ